MIKYLVFFSTVYWVRPYPLDRKSVRDPENPKTKNGTTPPVEKEQIADT